MEGFRAHPRDVVAPRGTGSVGREEFAQRADDFAHGRFSHLLSVCESGRRIAIACRVTRVEHSGHTVVEPRVRAGPLGTHCPETSEVVGADSDGS